MAHKFEIELTQTQLEILQLALQNNYFYWVDHVRNEATEFKPHDLLDEANLAANTGNLIASYELREIFGRIQ